MCDSNLKDLESGEFGHYIPIRPDDERLEIIEEYSTLLMLVPIPNSDSEEGHFYSIKTTEHRTNSSLFNDVKCADVTLTTYEIPINPKYKLINLIQTTVKNSSSEFAFDVIRNNWKEEWFSFVRI